MIIGYPCPACRASAVSAQSVSKPSNLDTDIMQTISLVPTGAIADLNQRIDRALTYRDRNALASVRAVVGWLATIANASDIFQLRQLEARTEAAVRFVGGQANV